MSGANITANCSFASINDFLVQAEAGALNVTKTIGLCPDICSLAWGFGNPDLSGIGANASYIIQGILVFFFGPVLGLAYFYVVKSDFRKDHLVKALDVFLDTNAQFTIPVSVAAIVRIKQSAPFYEITYLQSLMTMQFLGLLAIIVTSACIRELSDAKTKRSWPRIIVVSLYGLIDFSLYMGLVHHLHTSKASYLSLQQLAAACTNYGSLLPAFAYVQSPHPHGLSLPKVSDPYAIAPSFSDIKTSFHNLGIIFGIIIAIIVGLIAIFIFWKEIFEFFGGLIICAIVVSPLAFSIAVIYCLVRLEQKREIMKHITGVEFEDNQWGFGQVVALFLWVPVLFQTIYWIIESDKSDAQHGPDDSGESRLAIDRTTGVEKATQTAPESQEAQDAKNSIVEVQEVSTNTETPEGDIDKTENEQENKT